MTSTMSGLRGAPAGTRTERPRLRMRSTAISSATVLVVVAIWFGITTSGLVGPDYLPSPSALVSTFVEMILVGYSGTSLWGHIGISLFRTIVGFVLGSIVGIIVGLAAGYNQFVRALIAPITKFMRPIPPIAFIPLVVLYFGLGETGKVVLILVTSFNYTVVNAEAGALATPIAFRRAAATLGLSQRQEFFQVILPSALPSIFTGLRVALALSWAVVVAAELVGAQRGLGYMINNAALVLQMPVVYVGIILIGLIGLSLNAVLELVERRIVHWRGR